MKHSDTVTTNDKEPLQVWKQTVKVVKTVEYHKQEQHEIDAY